MAIRTVAASAGEEVAIPFSEDRNFPASGAEEALASSDMGPAHFAIFFLGDSSVFYWPITKLQSRRGNLTNHSASGSKSKKDHSKKSKGTTEV
jgi:hypothetical protein